MKVSQAKEKICPFMSKGQIVTNIEDGYTTSSHNDINLVNCIHSDCMAWKTTKSHGDEMGDFEEKIGNYTQIFKKRLELPEDEKKGYCVRLEEQK